ncbi:MAG: 50S ribosomal L9 C-terminal domain-containing protein [Haliscomenobacter sp.]
MGLDVERKKIDVPEDIKELGSYVAEVNVYKNMVAKVRFEVVAE